MRESPYIKSLPYHLPPVLGFAIVMAVTDREKGARGGMSAAKMGTPR